MSAKFIKPVIFILIIIAIFAGVSLPCGPYFSIRVLEQSDSFLLEAPEGFFWEEVKKVIENLDSYLIETNSLNRNLSKYKALKNINTEDVDVNDLSNAFKELNITNNVQSIFDVYEKARQDITNLKRAAYNWQVEKYYKGDRFDIELNPEPRLNIPEIPEGLPKEFEYYLQGAISYHLKQKEKAISIWKQLLELPVSQRKYRSTWAAFMIGKAFLDERPDEAIRWFEFTRELVDEGFLDSLALAAASIGWQAKAQLNLNNYVKAIELYCLDKDYVSLQRVCSEFLKADIDVQKSAAQNLLVRKIVASFIVSRGGMGFHGPSPEMTGQWLKVINAANVNTLEEAGYFAWAAYSIGDLELAQQWLVKTSQDDIMAQWIQAKLYLQNGKVTDAIKLLNKISRIISSENEANYFSEYDYGALPRDYVIRTIRGELGSLFISQSQYIDSLDVFVRGGYWEDAAFIAERILAIEELKTYVDKTWPDAIKEEYQRAMSLPEKLRYLLARRLARLERWEDARQYYPSKWRKCMDSYIYALTEGKNKRFSKIKRAEALWKAAIIARYNGMEIIGTEVEPDWTLYSGRIQRASIEESRKAHQSEMLSGSSEDELQRLTKNTSPEKRFHYRYIAIDLAWQAAELMPDNSEQTARVLCIAGSWIKDREPKEADKFYKAMVNRNKKNELGQEADKLRWFPEIDTEGLLEEAYSN